MAIEIVRPTDAYNPGTWTSTTNIWDNDLGTYGTKTDPQATPDISVGGAAAGEGTNSWGSKTQTWTAATLYVRFARTGGTPDDDTINVEYGKESAGYTKIADLVASTAAGVTLNTFSATLTESDFGTAWVDFANCRVRVNGVKVKGFDGQESRLHEVWIEGEYTLQASFLPTFSRKRDVRLLR